MVQPVKWFRSDMRGAPVRNGTPGSALAQYSACLITGFGDTPMISGNIVNNKAIFVFGAGLTFFKDAIVGISGATPAALNGEHIVRVSGDNTITINTGLPDGPITGTVNVKYAPVGGWSMPFSAPNTGVFKSLHPESLGHYYQVTDTNALWCGVRGYEHMTGVGQGTGFYPPNMANSSVGIARIKSDTANTLARYWFFIGDSQGFYDIARAYQYTLTVYDQLYTPWYAGELLQPGGIIDNYASIVQGIDSVTYNHNHSQGLHNNNTANNVGASDYFSTLSRNIYGDAGTLMTARTVFSSTMSNRYSGQGVVPLSGPRRKLSLTPPRVIDRDNNVRGMMPGVYCSEQLFPAGLGPVPGTIYPFPNFEVRDGTSDFFGRRVMSVFANDGTGGTLPTVNPSIVFFDLHGPWR